MRKAAATTSAAASRKSEKTAQLDAQGNVTLSDPARPRRERPRLLHPDRSARHRRQQPRSVGQHDRARAVRPVHGQRLAGSVRRTRPARRRPCRSRPSTTRARRSPASRSRSSLERLVYAEGRWSDPTVTAIADGHGHDRPRKAGPRGRRRCRRTMPARYRFKVVGPGRRPRARRHRGPLGDGRGRDRLRRREHLSRTDRRPEVLQARRHGEARRPRRQGHRAAPRHQGRPVGHVLPGGPRPRATTAFEVPVAESDIGDTYVNIVVPEGRPALSRREADQGPGHVAPAAGRRSRRNSPCRNRARPGGSC